MISNYQKNTGDYVIKKSLFAEYQLYNTISLLVSQRGYLRLIDYLR